MNRSDKIQLLNDIRDGKRSYLSLNKPVFFCFPEMNMYRIDNHQVDELTFEKELKRYDSCDPLHIIINAP